MKTLLDNETTARFWSLLKRRGREYWLIFFDYKAFLAVGAVLLLPAVLSLFMPGTSGCSALSLCSSGDTPWGIFTSIFVYDGWQNAAVFYLLALAYLPFSSHLGSTVRRNRSVFMAVAAFAAAIISNGIWTALRPLSVSYGQSGVVYAAWGSLVAFCVADAFPRGATWRSWGPKYLGREERGAVLANLAMVAATVGAVVWSPGIFLGEAPGVNAFVHAVGFLCGYLAVYAYRFVGESLGLRTDEVARL